MHLPSLEMAVYPVVTMGHGRHRRRSLDPHPISLCSARSQTSSTSSGVRSPDVSSIQKAIRSVFRSSRLTVQQAERLPGRLYQVLLVTLADGSSLVLKCPPIYNTRLLRHEKHGLETERRTLDILRKSTQLPVPDIIKYDRQRGSLGCPFLMVSHMPGRHLCELSPELSPAERRTVDRSLGAYVRAITTLSSQQFGPVHQVYAEKGHSSWKDAFLALLEAVLRDAEDMAVTIPYDNVRYHVRRHAECLSEVTRPRLVALDVCDPQNVLLDERTKKITGLVGFTNAIWGDPLMSGGMTDNNDAFFEGFGECPLQTGGVRTRLLMYTAYRAIVQVVVRFYRPHLSVDDMEARRSLTYALNELARMP
ncbi:uncharacterized protein EI97DRAFT_449070 [Westerdykella ornata]|uniref:Aminoglycoside phosphotransferase domain-containing protein n=1 Tax=Westerdykella ornata TaxID=318751 RepID=A0A6A6JRR4_WESOR|nr:uncharacterized protein EI97DRAFT_449070 [Westerdykella ornata]KAF2278416.1 hypothetical protein EI97DRAFT_449070 [Westerdykella ornata]